MRQAIVNLGVAVVLILSLAGCGGGGTSSLSPSQFVGTYTTDVTRSVTSRLVVNVDSNQVVTASLIDEANPIGGWFGQGQVDSLGNVSVTAANPANLTLVSINGSVASGSFAGSVTGATSVTNVTAKKLSSGGIQLTGSFTGTGTDKPVVGNTGTTTVTVTILTNQIQVNGTTSNGVAFSFTGTQTSNGLIQVTGTLTPAVGSPESVTVNGVIAPSDDGATVYGTLVLRDASTSLVVDIDSFVIHKQ